MKLYLLFLAMATVTVFSPGPGVVMTLSNALRYGVRDAFGGILGIAFGAFVVAAMAASTLGTLVAASTGAFLLMKLVGALYLVWLGLRLWRAPAFHFSEAPSRVRHLRARFIEALSLQLTNPNVILFFLAALPQFIEPSESYGVQFAALVLTYAALVIVIHSGYALCAHGARRWLTSQSGAQCAKRVAAVVFMTFGALLAWQ